MWRTETSWGWGRGWGRAGSRAAAGAAARGGHGVERAVPGGEHADLVLLLDDEVGDGGEAEAGVAELGDAAAGERHGRRGVEDEVDGELGFLLELLDVVAIELGVGFPVDVAQLVAR